MPMPEAEDLSRLPFLAIMAFTARCARRVQHLYKPTGDHRSQTCEHDLDRAVGVVEAYASGKAGKWQIRSVWLNPEDAVPGTDAAAQAARAAAKALVFTVKAAAFQHNDCILDAALAVFQASEAAKAAHFGVEFEDAALADFQRLLILDLGHYPDDGKEVDPTESGPLGPYWPSGWPHRSA